MVEEKLSLRELKKRMTREVIANAALQLTMEKGLSNVTIEEIARDAFVSPRTVSNYFPSKEEAVLAAGGQDALDLLDDFDDEPSVTPPLEALCELFSDYARERPDRLRDLAQKRELEQDNPTLTPYRTAQEARFEDALRARIARRTDCNAATDLYPSLVASAAMSALTTSLMLWARADYPDDTLPHLIQDAFNLVTAGYPHSVSPVDAATEVVLTA